MPRQFEITTRQGEIPLASNITASLKFNEVIYNFNGSKAALINNTSIFIIELDRNNMYEITNPDMTRIKSIAFSKDNRYLVALGYHQLNTRSTNITAIVKEYDLSQFTVEHKTYEYTISRNEWNDINSINRIKLTDDGNYFAFVTKNNTISIYNRQNGDNVINFNSNEILFFTFLSSDYTDIIVNYNRDNRLGLFRFQNNRYTQVAGVINEDADIPFYKLLISPNKLYIYISYVNKTNSYKTDILKLDSHTFEQLSLKVVDTDISDFVGVTNETLIAFNFENQINFFDLNNQGDLTSRRIQQTINTSNFDYNVPRLSNSNTLLVIKPNENKTRIIYTIYRFN